MNWIATLSGWIYLAVVVVLLVLVFLRKREPSEILAWSLSIVFLPVVGPLFFLLFGRNRVSRRLLRKIEHRMEFESRVAVPKDFDSREAPGFSDGPWGRLGATLESFGEAPRRAGNSIDFYTRGIDAQRALIEAVDSAREHIHVEFYIFRTDGTGRALIDRLIRKIESGVRVRLIVDGLGSLFGWRNLRRIRQAGGEAVFFLPPFSPKQFSPNLRNHRKLLICDGSVAFFGGMNVGEEYLGRSGRYRREWYDLHARIRGPAVWDLQRVFIEDWDFAAGTSLGGELLFPDVTPVGSSSIQILSSGPDFEPNAIRQAFFGAFTRARRSLLIATPYLIPDMALREALKTASRSGVDVRIVTQAPPPDQYLPYYCSRYYVEELVHAGVRIYGYEPGMMHAKAVAVDGCWAMVGTANLDNRSTYLNFEQMGILDRPEEAGAIHVELLQLIERSTEIRRSDLDARSNLDKALASVTHLFAPLL